MAEEELSSMEIYERENPKQQKKKTGKSRHGVEREDRVNE